MHVWGENKTKKNQKEISDLDSWSRHCAPSLFRILSDDHFFNVFVQHLLKDFPTSSTFFEETGEEEFWTVQKRIQRKERHSHLRPHITQHPPLSLPYSSLYITWVLWSGALCVWGRYPVTAVINFTAKKKRHRSRPLGPVACETLDLSMLGWITNLVL